MSKDSISSCKSDNNYSYYNYQSEPIAPGSKFSYSKDSIEYQNLRKDAATRFEQTAKRVIINHNTFVRIGKYLFLGAALPPYVLFYKIPKWILVSVIPSWVRFFTTQTSQCAKKVREGILNILKKISASVRKRIEPIAKAIQEMLRALAQLRQSIASLFSFQRLISNIKRSSPFVFLKEAPERIQKYIQMQFNKMNLWGKKQLDRLKLPFRLIKKQIENVKNSFVKIKNTLQMISNHLSTNFNKSKNLAEKVTKGVSDRVSDIKMKIQESLKAIGQGIKDVRVALFSPLANAMKAKIKEIFQHCSKKINSFNERFRRPFNAFGEKIKEVDWKKKMGYLFPEFLYAWLPDIMKGYFRNLWLNYIRKLILSIWQGISKATKLTFKGPQFLFKSFREGINFLRVYSKTFRKFLSEVGVTLSYWMGFILYKALYWLLIILFMLPILLSELLKLLQQSASQLKHRLLRRT